MPSLSAQNSFKHFLTVHYPLLILKEKNLCWHVCVRHPHKLPAYTLLENLTDDALAYVALCDEMFDHFPQI